MIECTFELNSRKMSALVCSNGKRYSAFSGRFSHVNHPESTHLADIGPLPKGVYYIVDKPKGGRFGWFHQAVDRFFGEDEWFGLYRDDGKIDDVTYIHGVKRGAFRLHPAGQFGVSKGCITLISTEQFQQLRSNLLRSRRVVIPGTRITAYGRVTVK